MTSPSAEHPFRIAVPDAQLEILRRKLELTTLPDELDDAGRDYGVPLSDIKRLLSRWKDGYDWRKHEASLNAELPQFTRKIEVDGHGVLDIHYVHKRSEVEKAIPLLFVHGWPGSFIEVGKILNQLVNASGEHPSFHVVALSLPGFGFSSAPTKKGFGVPQYAEVAHKLMLALGYDEYGTYGALSAVSATRNDSVTYNPLVTQGGDWGFYITQTIAVKYGGTHSKAWHTNFPRTFDDTELGKLLDTIDTGTLTNLEKAGLKRSEWFHDLGRGYSTQQRTQPQTLGYSLADSPVGLLAWIYEKLVNWTDNYPWDDDEVLTWISIYWFSKAGPTASLRIYYERRAVGWTYEAPKIPTGFSYFPQEVIRVPTKWLRADNLVFEAEHTAGGHFAAHEQPDLLVGDLRKMFGRGGPAFGVVPGKHGYA